MPNYIALTGKVEGEPEIQYSGSHHDQPQASFVLLFQTGNSRTGRIKVQCYRNLAKFVSCYLHQGATVAVAGVLNQREGGTPIEQGKSELELIARSMELTPMSS